MGLGKASFCAAVGAMSQGRRNIHSKYSAQFARRSITVEIVVIIRTHFRSPVGPKRSVLILSGLLPEAVRRLAALSTKDVGPQTKHVGPRCDGQVALAIRSESMRP